MHNVAACQLFRGVIGVRRPCRRPEPGCRIRERHRGRRHGRRTPRVRHPACLAISPCPASNERTTHPPRARLNRIDAPPPAAHPGRLKGTSAPRMRRCGTRRRKRRRS